jgi:hypothetical protein
MTLVQILANLHDPEFKKIFGEAHATEYNTVEEQKHLTKRQQRIKDLLVESSKSLLGKYGGQQKIVVHAAMNCYATLLGLFCGADFSNIIPRIDVSRMLPGFVYSHPQSETHFGDKRNYLFLIESDENVSVFVDVFTRIIRYAKATVQTISFQKATPEESIRFLENLEKVQAIFQTTKQS